MSTTIEQIVSSNVSMAIDQSEEYGGLEKAFQSFSQNVADTLIEEGYDASDVMRGRDWFSNEFKSQTGLEL